MGLTELFEQIVVLNVDTRLKEMDRITDLLRRHNYKGQIRQFLVGKGEILPRHSYSRIDEPRVSDIWNSGPFKHLPNSYHAFKAYQQIIGESLNKNRILILEDDVDFTENFDEIFNESYEQLLDNQDYFGGEKYLGQLLYLGANHTWNETYDLYKNIISVHGSVCWHAIGIHNSLFNEILSWTADRPIDLKAAEEFHNKYLCYAVWPSIAIQKPGYSNVEGKVRDYSEFWKNKGVNWK